MIYDQDKKALEKEVAGSLDEDQQVAATKIQAGFKGMAFHIFTIRI